MKIRLVTPTFLYPAIMSKVIFSLAFLLTSTLAIKVYQSSKSPNPFFPIGLKLITKSESNFTQGLTICGRFNYQLLSRESNLFWIGTSYDDLFIWSYMGYKETFIGFGGHNSVVKDGDDNFLLWGPNRWHHICLAYDRPTAHLLFVKVRICHIGWNLSNIRNILITNQFILVKDRMAI